MTELTTRVRISREDHVNARDMRRSVRVKHGRRRVFARVEIWPGGLRRDGLNADPFCTLFYLEHATSDMIPEVV
jgi:hypothetical protein